MAVGGLSGGLLGLVGPPVYLLAVFEFMVIVGIIRCSECDFQEAFFMLLYGMAPALAIVRSSVLVTVALVSGANGVVVGLVASIFAGRLRRPLMTTAVICGAIAIIPVAIYLPTSLSQYVSNNIIFAYAPSVLYVSAMVLLGVALHRRISSKGQQADV